MGHALNLIRQLNNSHIITGGIIIGGGVDGRMSNLIVIYLWARKADHQRFGAHVEREREAAFALGTKRQRGQGDK